MPLSVLALALSGPLLLFAAEDWQEITTTRLPSPVTPIVDSVATTSVTTIVEAEDVNATAAEAGLDEMALSSVAQINGAFGIVFDEPLDARIIKGLASWQAPPPLPAGQIYNHPGRAFSMSVVQVQPVELPELLSEAEHQYSSFVDFDNKPVWVIAQIIRDMPDVLAILTRKYGEPTLSDNTQWQFSDGKNIIRVNQDEQVGTLEYIHIAGLAAYLRLRNMSLRDKFTATPRPGLSPDESRILALADQVAIISSQQAPAFGLPFGRRVNFRATPGKPVAFIPPRPLQGLDDGHYTIVVSPKLLPMVASLTLTGSAAELAGQKQLLDEALLVVFGRFLKHSSQHSVISTQGLSMSVLLRGGVLTLSVHDATESRRVRNAERVQQHIVAENAATARKLQAALDAEAMALTAAENARLAELEAQRLQMEARRAEQGF